jgi:hypothetical protein
MAYAVSLVPFGYLHAVLPQLSAQLQKSEFWTNGRASVDDIIRFLYNGHMQLWIAHVDGQQFLGYVITEIKEYPRCKMLVMQYCAGDTGSLEDVGDLVFETLERYAKDAGCSGIEFFGRPGWTPHAKKHGCTVQTVVYEKYFGERT